MIQKHCFECGMALIEKELEEEGIVPYCPKCQQYRFPMYNVAVSMIVVDEEIGKILLIQQYGKPSYILVAGYVNRGEAEEHAVVREVREETGMAATAASIVDWKKTSTFEIFEEWRHRYAPDVRYNTEHVFSLVVEDNTPVVIAPGEHTSHCWLDYEEAATRVFSWSNRDAILELPDRLAAQPSRTGASGALSQ